MHAAALLLVGLLASGLVGGIVYRDVLLQSHTLRLEQEVARADASARLARRHLERVSAPAGQGGPRRPPGRACPGHPVRDAGRSRLVRGRAGSRRPGLRVALPQEAWRVVTSSCCPTDKPNGSISLPCPPMAGPWLPGTRTGRSGLRDPETGRVRMTLRGHQLPVDLFAFSPDGRRLVSRGTRRSDTAPTGRSPPLGPGLGAAPGPPGGVIGPNVEELHVRSSGRPPLGGSLDRERSHAVGLLGRGDRSRSPPAGVEQAHLTWHQSR